MRRWVAAVVTVGLLCTGCGSGPKALPPAPALPTSTVPSKITVLQTKIVVKANKDRRTQQAFASVGSASLVKQAGVWELRKGVRLVGTLQLATLDPHRVDTARSKDRAAILQQILIGNPTQLDLDGLPIWSSKDADRVVFVWYGRQVLGVLQVKADSLDPEETMNTVVSDVVNHAGWPALPLDVFDDGQT